MTRRAGRGGDLGQLGDLADAESVPNEEVAAPRSRSGRLARSTAFFSAATALSRVAGLAREILAAGFFGVSRQMSAFTYAFAVPNLVRSLFADAAIQAAFVPVFTEKLEAGEKREAFRLAATLLYLVALVLALLTTVFILLAPVLMPLIAQGFGDAGDDLTIALTQLLFPILLLLGITGMVVGVLNSYDRFGALAIAPFFWNIAIIAVLVGFAPVVPARDEIYLYAYGVLAGTVVQLMICAYDLRNTPFRLLRVFDWRSPGVRRVLLLMLPVTISLGLINFNLLINAIFGGLLSDPDIRNLGAKAPAAIDKAFRIYMLPQGIFSVAVTTVLFPTLARYAARRDYDDLRATMANGMRQILLLLIPAAAAILVLSEPMTRIVYERGDFGETGTDLVSTALFWFAFSLPFNGLFLLLTRTFFSLQRPWVPTVISGLNLAVTALFCLLFYKPFGVGGIVAATAIATLASVVAQAVVLRRQLGRLELDRLLRTTAQITIAAGALAITSYSVWVLLDEILGRSLVAQVIAIGFGLISGAVIYGVAITLQRVPEAEQIWRVVRRR